MTVQVEALTYEALKAKCDHLEQINTQTLQIKLTMAETIKELTDRVERLSGMLTESRVATKSAEERADALEVRLRNALSSEQESIQRAHAANQTIDALAVENQALKGVVGEINEELYGKGLEVSGWHLNGDLEPLDNWFTDNVWGTPETPATDAALAAIQAQGVEKAAEALDALSAQSASATTQGNFRAAAVYLRTTVLPAIGEAK
ncbi:hypothetical protein [Serratia marcescens]|uniref:hypothetical protein n=1 Tax=Serratia marcescens TaxID=615 RepID=UPI003702C6BA